MPDDQRKTTLGYAPPQQAKSLEDLAFMADLGIDDAYLSRGLYLLLQRAFLTGANVYLAHILDRSDDERLQTLYSARDQTEQALAGVQRAMEARGYEREFANTLAEQVRHRISKRWL
jgi:hypothetical protein